MVEVVEETLQGRVVRLLGQKKTNGRKQGETPLSCDLPLSYHVAVLAVMPFLARDDAELWWGLGGASLDLPKIRKNPLIEIIPINTGCLNQCTYCKTKHARGDLGSYSVEEIVDRVRSVVKGPFSLIALCQRLALGLKARDSRC